MQAKISEQHDKKRLMESRMGMTGELGPGLDDTSLNHQMKPYQDQPDLTQMQLMQLTLLEQQNRRRLMMARKEQEQTQETYSLQDYRTQLMQLEQQDQAHLRKVREGKQSSEPEVKMHSLQDYQIQLMLLEKKNKLRLIIARMEHDQGQEQELEQAEHGSATVHTASRL